MKWLASFAEKAVLTDQLRTHKDRNLLLAAGLFGEAGSVLAELKKMEREGPAYPNYRKRLLEEVGDCLWYFVRLVSEVDATLLEEFLAKDISGNPNSSGLIEESIAFGAAVGNVLDEMKGSKRAGLRNALAALWPKLVAVAAKGQIDLDRAAEANLTKTVSRWPETRTFPPLFDEEFPEEEQFPRTLTLEFLERKRKARTEVILRCNDLNIGSRLTDNIADADGYRYHDAFHLSYVVFLGWSPVIRKLLRCKRKSRPKIDETEDGARAAILEEGISAIVFSRAKNMNFFENTKQIDYDLLKNISEFIQGFEVARTPLWQWETAILEGFRMFRELRKGEGGIVTCDLHQHRIAYSPLRGNHK